MRLATGMIFENLKDLEQGLQAAGAFIRAQGDVSLAAHLRGVSVDRMQQQLIHHFETSDVNQIYQ